MNGKKYVIIRYHQKILSLLFQDNRLLRATAEEVSGNILGNVYVAKVKNIVKNIKAAFVEIEPGLTCFLALDGLRNPVLTNREYDGRILAEDEILVQVSKEAVKTKPPAVTGQISLDGRYCVVSKGRPGIAYSSKLSSKVKQRIEEKFLEDTFPIEAYAGKFGVIIRTNVKELREDLTPLYKEIENLGQRMAKLIKAGKSRTCYSLLYQKPEDYVTFLRDGGFLTQDEVVTDEKEIYDRIKEYALANPDFFLPAVRLYEDERIPLAKLYAVETRLKEATEKKVWLKSGGYLVIEPTEALTVIDVNTGKITAKKETEELYCQINMEAAKEIALQLTLRNLSGIIVVDFINMQSKEHNKQLMAYLGDLLKKDSVRTQLVDITPLGLVEITRMKINKPLRDQLI